MSNSQPVPAENRRSRLRFAARVAALLSCNAVAPPAHAESKARGHGPRRWRSTRPGVYELDAKLDLTLPEEARRASRPGSRCGSTTRSRSTACGATCPTPTSPSLEQSYELSYHALSQRYLVRNLNTGEQQDFGDAAGGARRRSATVRGLPLIDSSLLEHGPSLRIPRARGGRSAHGAGYAEAGCCSGPTTGAPPASGIAWTFRP